MNVLLIPEICNSTIKVKYSNCNDYFYVDKEDKGIVDKYIIRKSNKSYATTIIKFQITRFLHNLLLSRVIVLLNLLVFLGINRKINGMYL